MSCGLSPGDWKATVEASSPMFYDGPLFDQSTYDDPATRVLRSPKPADVSTLTTIGPFVKLQLLI